MDFDQNISESLEGMESVQKNVIDCGDDNTNKNELALKDKMPLSGEGDALNAKDLQTFSESLMSSDNLISDNTNSVKNNTHDASNDLNCFEATSDFASELIQNICEKNQSDNEVDKNLLDFNVKDNLDVQTDTLPQQDTEKVISEVTAIEKEISESDKILNTIEDDSNENIGANSTSVEEELSNVFKDVLDSANKTARLHGFSQATMSRICFRVTRAIASLIDNYIKFPDNEEIPAVKSKFFNIANMRNIVGAIDGTHIKIKNPGGEYPALYINRKGYFSLNVQAGEINGILIGDNGYPSTNFLLTPVINPNTPAQVRYNMAHIRTRNVVERLFGQWKNKFRCFFNGMQMSLYTAKASIIALAILHNISLDERTEEDDDETVPESSPKQTENFDEIMETEPIPEEPTITENEVLEKEKSSEVEEAMEVENSETIEKCAEKSTEDKTEDNVIQDNTKINDKLVEDKSVEKVSPPEETQSTNEENPEKPAEEEDEEKMDTSEPIEIQSDETKDSIEKDDKDGKDEVDSKSVENVDEASNDTKQVSAFDSLFEDGNTSESTKKSVENVEDERTIISEGDDRSMEENPFFVHVSDKNDNNDADKNDSSANNEHETTENMNEEDPFKSVQIDTPKEDSNDFDPNLEKQPMKVVDNNIIEDLVSGKGADEELCIIPDTEREISQEEKDAATAKAAAPKASTVSVDESSEKVAEPATEGAEKAAEEATSAGKSNEVNHVETAQETKLVFNEISESDAAENLCQQCNTRKSCRFSTMVDGKTIYICNSECVESYKQEKAKSKPANKVAEIKLRDMTSSMNKSTPTPAVVSKPFSRQCSQCAKEITDDTIMDKILTWETMEFCNEGCLAKYQTKIGSNCANCKKSVAMSSLGKYCVRFGHDIRQFCCSLCLEEFKKGLKVCSYCQKDISADQGGFLAPIGDKGQFKDFCSQLCMENFDLMSNKNMTRPLPSELGVCSVCANEKQLSITFEKTDSKNKFCSEPCFVAFKFVNNVDPLHCDLCKKYFETENSSEFSIHTDSGVKNFCSKTCQNIHIISNRRIVPCSWCKVKKYNFDMIKKVCQNGQVLNMCSLNCLSLFQVSVNAVSAKKLKCDFCQKMIQAQYHLTMSDATLRNFCSYQCLISFQNQFPTAPFTFGAGPAPTSTIPIPTPTGPARKNYNYNNRNARQPEQDQPLLITNVQSLANSTPAKKQMAECGVQVSVPIPPVLKQQVIMRPLARPQVKNKMTFVRPITKNVGIDCNPKMVNKEIQTDPQREKVRIVPVPVPIYVPAPLHMFARPIPVPVPFPLPVPVPIFIPTTRNSAAGIMKEIKKIQVKIPTDPFEAELLMMAEMVAGEKKIENTDSESEDDDHGADMDGGAAESFSPEAVDTSNTFGEDMLQMALKMATELDEPAVDLEGALTANTITASQNQEAVQGGEENVDDPQPLHAHHQLLERGQAVRGRKRQMRSPRGAGNAMPPKRGRRMSSNVEMPMLPPPQPAPPPEPIEKPDANMCLKYTFGVNAWKQWVTTKNAELEKSSRKILFKNEILQLSADELNYSLCLFVKEVRKPNGTEYAPDTIYYLCLGIQQYLFENGRIDNIFTDTYYEKFTDCLDEVARKFSVLYNDSHYIVTRVEEEHLWESKQLGAHSPHVLLSTLMFFNTKHFNLTTVDEHMQLSFSHIMKHWKRNPNQPGTAKVPGSRNVLLRFYPPQSTLDNNTRKKKVYEQQENEENPLRCPVKLYEFYLSKCPESVKTRNDVFYLQPERSCVPDSPVWYSTMALGREALEKMLHRVKMVKEINVALLTS